MAKKKYTQESLGTMVVFLMPSLKLKEKSKSGKNYEDVIHLFLLKKFGGYTAAAGNIFGYWKNFRGKEFYGEHKEYKVSFRDQKKIPVLIDFLAKLASEMKEESLYLERGDQAYLLYP